MTNVRPSHLAPVGSCILAAGDNTTLFLGTDNKLL